MPLKFNSLQLQLGTVGVDSHNPPTIDVHIVCMYLGIAVRFATVSATTLSCTGIFGLECCLPSEGLPNF